MQINQFLVWFLVNGRFSVLFPRFFLKRTNWVQLVLLVWFYIVVLKSGSSTNIGLIKQNQTGPVLASIKDMKPSGSVSFRSRTRQSSNSKNPKTVK